jgi:amidohydrolase
MGGLAISDMPKSNTSGMDSELSKLLDERIESIHDLIVGFRRELHQWPEAGFEEFKTAELIESFLGNLPELEIERGIGRSGLVATLNSGHEGPCIAFRADMDGLPILEQTGLDYASKSKGWMHACGHDGHCAIQAGLAIVLSSMKDHLIGPVKFIFQPAEEGKGGAREMILAGALAKPDVKAIFGLHGWPSLKKGMVGFRKGSFFASTDRVVLKVKGKGGHAAMPHLTIDPVVIAANIITAAQSLVSRRVSPQDAVVISFTNIEGGSADNIIPEEVTVRGTVRFLKESQRYETIEALKVLCEGTARAMGGEASLEVLQGGYPVLECNEALVERFRKEASAVIGERRVVSVEPTMGGEDFAYYAQEIPACFWLLGMDSTPDGNPKNLHTPKFDFNDDVIALGIRLQAQMAFRAFQFEKAPVI